MIYEFCSVAMLFNGNQKETAGTQKVVSIIIEVKKGQDEFDILASAMRYMRKNRNEDVAGRNMVAYEISSATFELTNEELTKEIVSRVDGLSEGSWDCEQSPTGKCITKDEGYDEICIFCGDPEERK